jgi:hypothetical protein
MVGAFTACRIFRSYLHFPAPLLFILKQKCFFFMQNKYLTSYQFLMSHCLDPFSLCISKLFADCRYGFFFIIGHFKICITSLLMNAITDHSAYLGNVFVAVGSAELSKMASYTTEQKVFVVRTCYFSGVLVLLRRAGIIERSCCIIEKHYLPDC